MQIAEIKSKYPLDWYNLVNEEAEELIKQAKRRKLRIPWTIAHEDAESRMMTWIDTAAEEADRLTSMSEIACFVASHRRTRVWCVLTALSD